MTVLVALAAVLAVTGCAAAWLMPSDRAREVGTVAMVAGAAVLGLCAAVPGPVDDPEEVVATLLAVVLAPVAVLGGSPVTAGVLRLADRESAGAVVQAATVLRGGAWIGVFERTGVFAALVAGWPEGIAIVLGLKGLGRYSELKADGVSTGSTTGLTGSTTGSTGASGSSGVAERFIIGSFCSVLWAAGCAGMLVGLVG